VARVLIIGGGFAGLAAAGRLSGPAAHGRFQVTLADRRDTHQFLPVLPDLVGRDIRPEDVQYPLAEAAHAYGFRFVPEAVKSVDLGGRTAVTDSGATLPFDFLLVASGSESDFHGREDCRGQALTLHSVADVLALRAAARDERTAAMVVAGGGYTGVEGATNLWRAARGRESPLRIVIVETGAALCAALPPRFQAYIGRNVCSLGIEVRTGTAVAEVSGGTVQLSSGESLDRARLLWAAGVCTSALVRALPAEKTPNGRLLVDESLRFAPGCFAAGDAAAFRRDGQPLRMGVQFSLSEGAAAADNIRRAAEGRPLRGFRPFDPGYLVPMANGRACGKVLGAGLRGRLPMALHYAMCLLRLRGMGRRWGLLRSLLRRE